MPRRLAPTPRPHRRGSTRLALVVAVALGAGALGGTTGITCVVLSAAALPWWRRRSARQRRERAVRRELPEAIELLVLLVRAGRVPAAAVVDVATRLRPPLAGAFDAVRARLDEGQRFADAIQALPAHLGPIARPAADALATADRYGLPLAPMLESLVDEARRQRRRQADAEARQLPVRLSAPLVLCTLPAFVLVAIVPLLIGALSSLDLGG